MKEGRKLDLIPAWEMSFGQLLLEAEKHGIRYCPRGEITSSFRGLNQGYRVFDLKG